MTTTQMKVVSVEPPTISPRINAGLYTNTAPTSISITTEKTNITFLAPFPSTFPTTSETTTPPPRMESIPVM